MFRRTLLAATITTLMALNVTLANAQEYSKGTVVVYPIVFSRDSGTSDSRETAVQSVEEVLQKAGYNLVSETVAAHTWDRLQFPMVSTSRSASMRNIVQFGKEVRADFVVSPVFDFHSRSIWVDFGPRTVSTVTATIKITRVRTGEVVYTMSKQARSDEKLDVLKAAGAVLISPLITAVSGGPKTPQEQRAAQVAVARAMRGFVRGDIVRGAFVRR